jgi:hypothetical protein
MLSIIRIAYFLLYLPRILEQTDLTHICHSDKNPVLYLSLIVPASHSHPLKKIEVAITIKKTKDYCSFQLAHPNIPAHDSNIILCNSVALFLIISSTCRNSLFQYSCRFFSSIKL